MSDLRELREQAERDRMAEEELVREKFDVYGDRWEKVYFGGGKHFQNWFNQVMELAGENNVEIEEVSSEDLQCFQQGDEKLYRIWVKAGTMEAYEDIF